MKFHFEEISNRVAPLDLKNVEGELRVQHGKWEVCLHEDKFQGWFEHDDHGEGGGLWFEWQTGWVLTLTDYDGTFELPRKVLEVLVQLGIDVTYVTECDSEGGEL
jgi:hypothetical protein